MPKRRSSRPRRHLLCRDLWAIASLHPVQFSKPQDLPMVSDDQKFSDPTSGAGWAVYPPAQWNGSPLPPFTNSWTLTFAAARSVIIISPRQSSSSRRRSSSPEPSYSPNSSIPIPALAILSSCHRFRPSPPRRTTTNGHQRPSPTGPIVPPSLSKERPEYRATLAPLRQARTFPRRHEQVILDPTKVAPSYDSGSSPLLWEGGIRAPLTAGLPAERRSSCRRT
jgi:hypothetical protein